MKGRIGRILEAYKKWIRKLILTILTLAAGFQGGGCPPIFCKAALEDQTYLATVKNIDFKAWQSREDFDKSMLSLFKLYDTLYIGNMKGYGKIEILRK